MKIGFRDGGTQQLFNDHVRLEARYGSEVADKIASRMALLSVAKSLGQLPTCAPIRLRPYDGVPGLFTMDLGRQHRLQLLAIGEKAAPGGPLVPEATKEIQVIGIEDV